MEFLIASQLKTGRIYALDTVTLVYFLERHPVYYPTAREVFSRIEAGDISGVLSAMVFAELLVPAFREGKSKLADKVVRILSHFPNLNIVPVSTEISIRAARLRAEYGLRTPDSIHAATALLVDATGIISNDRDLLKMEGTGLDVILFG